MDWLGQVKDTVKKTAVAAYDKSEQLVDIAKLKLAITSAENESEKLCKELGLIFYEQIKNGKTNDEKAKEICEKIDEKFAEIENNKDKIALIKKTKRCSSCGKEVAEDASFCPGCGNMMNSDNTNN